MSKGVFRILYNSMIPLSFWFAGLRESVFLISLLYPCILIIIIIIVLIARQVFSSLKLFIDILSYHVARRHRSRIMGKQQGTTSTARNHRCRRAALSFPPYPAA